MASIREINIQNQGYSLGIYTPALYRLSYRRSPFLHICKKNHTVLYNYFVVGVNLISFQLPPICHLANQAKAV